jgi:hypothetical protein
MTKSRIETQARGNRKWSNERQFPNFRVVCVALGTGYTRVRGIGRASRNGLVRDLPPEIPIRPNRVKQITVRHSSGGDKESGGVGEDYPSIHLISHVGLLVGPTGSSGSEPTLLTPKVE